MCSSPSVFIISVPDAGILPNTPFLVSLLNSFIISSGNPFGYVGKGFFRFSPVISQCPVVVSFPADFFL